MNSFHEPRTKDDSNELQLEMSTKKYGESSKYLFRFSSSDDDSDSDFEVDPIEKEKQEFDQMMNRLPHKTEEKREENEEKEHEENEENEEHEEKEEKEAKAEMPTKIIQLLKSIKQNQTGDFFEFGTLESFSSPGLEVEGIGLIRFPIMENQFEQLKQKCEAQQNSSYFQLDCSKLNFNETFQTRTILQKIKPRLQQGLGISNLDINLKLDKLLLFEKDSFLKCLKNSENDGKTFAKLIVFLPSIFEGGENVIQHEIGKRTLEFSNQSKFYELTWVSFYSKDCEFEFQHLKSGNRIALVYNISTSTPIFPIPKPIQSSMISKFNTICEEWKQKPSILAIGLKHKYSNRFLRISDLKSEDLAMIEALRSLSKHSTTSTQQGIEVHLVTIHQTEKGSRMELEIDHWVDLNDDIVPLGNIPIDRENLFPENSLNSIKPFMKFSTKYGFSMSRLGFIVIWPKENSRLVLASNQRNISAIFSDYFNEAKGCCPKFDRENVKWKKVLKVVGWLVGFDGDLGTKMIEFYDLIDSAEDPMGRKNTKQFITKPNSMETNDALISKLSSLIVQHGGWNEWKSSILSFARVLERPFALLNWLLDECCSTRPIFIKTNQKREEIREISKQIISSCQIRPQVCLIISKLGDIDLAQKMLPQLLEIAWKMVEQTMPNREQDIRTGSAMTFQHITSLLQGFGFNEKLCDIVRNFVESQIMLESESNQNQSLFVIWSMFFQQSSLRRLRLESAMNIVRFGRLIGTNSKISNKKLATLKLVLNEFGSSRLSAKETNQLIIGSLNRNTLLEQNKDSKIPFFVEKTFFKNYFVNQKLENEHYMSNYKFLGTLWDRPKLCLNEDLSSEGPPGIGGKAKQRFARSMFQIVSKNELFENEDDIVYYSILHSTSLMLLSLAANFNEWEKFKAILAWIQTSALSNSLSRWQENRLFIPLNDCLVVACRNFQLKHFDELVDLLKKTFILFPPRYFASYLENFLSDQDIEKNSKIISQLLSFDCFWNDTKDAPLLRNAMEKIEEFTNLKIGKFRKEEEKKNEKNTKIKLEFPLSESNLFQFISQYSDGIGNRIVQVQLMELPQTLEKLLVIAKFVFSKCQNKPNEIEQGRRICQLTLNIYFKELYQHPTEDIDKLFLKAFEETPRPENADGVFRKIMNICCDVAVKWLGVKFDEYSLDVLLGIYATPELFREFLKQKQTKKEILNFIELCVPPIPFPIQPFDDCDADEFQEWMSKNDSHAEPGWNAINNSLIRLSQDRHMEELLNLKFCRYFGICGTSNVLGWEHRYYYEIQKKWIVYLELKKEFSSDEQDDGERQVKKRKLENNN